MNKKKLKKYAKKKGLPIPLILSIKEKKNKMNTGGLSSGQAKIAAKAPPPNKIDAKDFAVLRAEKAKGRGMGLQEEKVKPGKVMKAKRGVFSSGKISDMSFDEKMKRVESGQINKKTGKFTSMNAMRDAKGFQKGESAAEFNKRRMKLERAAKVAKSTRLGKILLPVVGAAVAAKTYLNSKMNKKKDVKKKMGGGMMMQKPMGYKSGMGPAGAAGPSAGRPGGRRPMQQGPKGGIGSLSKNRSNDDLVILVDAGDGKVKKMKRSEFYDNMSAPKQKMGGGMMKKYSKGGGADMSGSRYKAFQTTQDVLKTLKDLPTGQEKLQNTIKQAKNFVKRLKAQTRDTAKVQTKMGGGMIAPSQRPGYSKGTMVKARGCKLGRTRPTKIT